MLYLGIMSVTDSTHVDIKTVVNCWHDVHMTVYTSFSGLTFARKVLVEVGRISG